MTRSNLELNEQSVLNTKEMLNKLKEEGKKLNETILNTFLDNSTKLQTAVEAVRMRKQRLERKFGDKDVEGATPTFNLDSAKDRKALLKQLSGYDQEGMWHNVLPTPENIALVDFFKELDAAEKDYEKLQAAAIMEYEDMHSGVQINTLKSNPTWRQIFRKLKDTYNVQDEDFMLLMKGAKQTNISSLMQSVQTNGAKDFEKGYKSLGTSSKEKVLAAKVATLLERIGQNPESAKLISDIAPILQNNSITEPKVLWEKIARTTRLTKGVEGKEVKEGTNKIAFLLGDLNADGRVDSKDGGQINGAQLAKMYENEKIKTNPGSVVKNIVGFLNIFKDTPIQGVVDSEEALYDHLIKNPADLMTLRNNLNLLGNNAVLVFTKGANVSNKIMERLGAKAALEQSIREALKKPEVLKKLNETLETGYANLIKEIVENKDLPEDKKREMLERLNDKDLKQKTLRKFRITALDAGVLAVKDKVVAAGGVSLTSDTLNKALADSTNSVINSITFLPNVGTGGVGLGLTIGGGRYSSAKLNDKGDKSVNRYLGGNLTKNGFLIGGGGMKEWQTNYKQIQDDLFAPNAKFTRAGISAYYAPDGVHAVATVGRKYDQDVAKEQQVQELRTYLNMQHLISDAFLGLDTLTGEKLTKENVTNHIFNHLDGLFPGSKQEVKEQKLRPFAQKLADLWLIMKDNPNKNGLDEGGVLNEILEPIITAFQNEKVEGWSNIHLESLGLVVDVPLKGAPSDVVESVVLSILGTAQVAFRKKTKYTENTASAQSAKDQLDRGYSVNIKEDSIGEVTKDNIDKINKLYNVKDAFTLSADGSQILVDKKAFADPKIKLVIDKKYFDYVTVEGDKVILPSLSMVLHSGYLNKGHTHIVSLGRNWTAGGEELSLKKIEDNKDKRITKFERSDLIESDDVKRTVTSTFDKLKATLAKKDPSNSVKDITLKWEGNVLQQIKNGSITNINLSDDILTKKKGKLILDMTADKVTATYNDEVDAPFAVDIKYREQLKIEIPEVEGKWSTFYDNALVEGRILTLKNTHDAVYTKFQNAMDKKDFVNAAVEANKIIVKLKGKNEQAPGSLTGIDPKDIEALKALNAKFAITSVTWSKDITNEADKDIITKNTEFKGILSGERQEKLHKDLLSKLLNARLTGGQYDGHQLYNFKEIIGKEKTLQDGQDDLLAKRATLVEKTGDDKLYGSQKIDNAIALVFGYDSQEVKEKFSGHPKIATKVDKEGKNTADLYSTSLDNPKLKEYFLTNMIAKTDHGLHLAQSIVKQAGLPNGTEIDPKAIKDALLGDGTLKAGDKVITIGADFAFAFYAECFNESIVMQNFRVENVSNEVVSVVDYIANNPVNTFNTANRDKVVVSLAGGAAVTKSKDISSETDIGNDTHWSETDTGNTTEGVDLGKSADNLEDIGIDQTPPVVEKTPDISPNLGEATLNKSLDPRAQSTIDWNKITNAGTTHNGGRNNLGGGSFRNSYGYPSNVQSVEENTKSAESGETLLDRTEKKLRANPLIEISEIEAGTLKTVLSQDTGYLEQIRGKNPSKKEDRTVIRNAYLAFKNIPIKLP